MDVNDFALSFQTNWLYLIRRLLEVFTNLEFGIIVGASNPEKFKIIYESLQNLTICKELYISLLNSVADNLRKYFNYIPKEKLDEINKDLRLNYLFISFNNQYNS